MAYRVVGNMCFFFTTHIWYHYVFVVFFSVICYNTTTYLHVLTLRIRLEINVHSQGGCVIMIQLKWLLQLRKTEF